MSDVSDTSFNDVLDRMALGLSNLDDANWMGDFTLKQLEKTNEALDMALQYKQLTEQWQTIAREWQDLATFHMAEAKACHEVVLS